jgi:hypothetical protein
MTEVLFSISVAFELIYLMINNKWIVGLSL